MRVQTRSLLSLVLLFLILCVTRPQKDYRVSETLSSGELLNAFTELYALGLGTLLKLPKIVAMGDQTAGKSSVIEGISGLNLPRGSGLVTRVPSIVAMIRDEDAIEPRILIEGEPVANADLADRILEIQNKKAGSGKNIKDDPILIRVYSRNVVDLTLIDLPGIVKNRMADQPATIVKDVQEMIRGYISQEETIILTVFAANVDLATVDAIRIARKYDPKLRRTVGVTTKVDLVNTEAEVINKLNQENMVCPIGLGVYAVKNRNPHEVEMGIGIPEARENERTFFASTSYGLTWPMHLGIENLAVTLSEVLHDSLVRSLPDLREKLEDQLEETEQNLLKYGKPLPKDTASRKFFLSDLVSNIDQRIQSVFTVGHVEDTPIYNLVDRVDQLFHEFAEKILSFEPRYLDGTRTEAFRKELEKSKGLMLRGFYPYPLFEKYQRETLHDFRNFSTSLVRDVVKEVRTTVLQMIEEESYSLDRIRRFLETQFDVFFRPVTKRASDGIQEIHAEEESFMYSQGYMPMMKGVAVDSEEESDEGTPELWDEKDLADQLITTPHSSPSRFGWLMPWTWFGEIEAASPQDESSANRGFDLSDARVFQYRLQSYHFIAAKRMIDTVPRRLYHRLIHNIKANFRHEMHRLVRVVHEDQLAKLMFEDPRIKETRERLQREIEQLEKGLAVVDRLG